MDIIALHQDAWSELLAWRPRLPHALLLVARSGVGAFELAKVFSGALLCEAKRGKGLDSGEATDERLRQACGACPACRWLREGNHPDFHLIQPEMLTASEALTPSTDQTSSESDSVAGEGTGKKKLGEQIKIDQIRALDEVLNIGTHRSGLRIILIHPAETMNHHASNALLKMLEEPPQDTLFLLVSYQLERLPPTIKSRCQRLHLPVPSDHMAHRYLNEAGVDEHSAQKWLAISGGAPLLAHELARDGQAPWVEPLLACLAEGATADTLAVAAELDGMIKKQKNAQGGVLGQIVLWVQKWLLDLALCKVNLPIRYFKHEASHLQALAGQCSLVPITRFGVRLCQIRGEAEQPLNTRLFIEDLLLSYQHLYHRAASGS